MSLRGMILLIGLVAIFSIQSFASGATWKQLGYYHWGGVVVALGLLWLLVWL